MRRGIPSNPSRCCGKKARLKPMKTSQKWSFPSFSSSIRPKNLGHQ